MRYVFKLHSWCSGAGGLVRADWGIVIERVGCKPVGLEKETV